MAAVRRTLTRSAESVLNLAVLAITLPKLIWTDIESPSSSFVREPALTGTADDRFTADVERPIEKEQGEGKHFGRDGGCVGCAGSAGAADRIVLMDPSIERVGVLGTRKSESVEEIFFGFGTTSRVPVSTRAVLVGISFPPYPPSRFEGGAVIERQPVRTNTSPPSTSTSYLGTVY